MSFGVYVQVFGEPWNVQELEEAFEGRLEKCDDSWRLGEARVDIDLRPPFGSTFLAVSRPTFDDELWRGLYRILERGDAVFFFPSERLLPVVADIRAAGMMPQEMRRDFASPLVVRSVGELVDSVDFQPDA